MRKQDTYLETMNRLKRIGINTSDYKSVVIALTEEIDYYRKKIEDIEKFIKQSPPY